MLRPDLKCGGLESKFGRDLDPVTGEWWVGPACAWGTSGRVFWGTQLGTLIHELLAIRYDLSTVQQRSKNQKIKDSKMILIAYHLLESSTGAYIEWLVNELMLTANKIKYKDVRIVMLLQMQ